MNNRPLILISNDDGIEAKGLYALVDFMSAYGDIVVAAPQSHQSAKSSSLTMDFPLRVNEMPEYHGAKMYRISGTPTDCTKLALNTLLDRKPDFIVAGINHGANSGNNVIYSGTMGVVFEGCMAGIPSVGFSLLSHDPNADFSNCEPVVKKVMDNVVANGLPNGICLNVNIPKNVEVKGLKICRAAKGSWSEEFVKRTDTFGRDYYWISGNFNNAEAECTDTDLYWLERGYASVVPCQPEQTAFSVLDDMKKIYE